MVMIGDVTILAVACAYAIHTLLLWHAARHSKHGKSAEPHRSPEETTVGDSGVGTRMGAFVVPGDIYRAEESGAKEHDAPRENPPDISRRTGFTRRREAVSNQ